MARGEAPRLANPSPQRRHPPSDGSWTRRLNGDGGGRGWGRGRGFWLGAQGMSGFPSCVFVCVWQGEREATWVHRLKVNVPYQHKKEHMSSAPPNYCHIEQFKHLI